MVFWKKKVINLGDQGVTELTILEWKKLFSLKLFHFHKTDGDQDRFHTHAFNALSIRLHGDYVEEVIDDTGRIIPLKRSRKRFLFIPKNQYHRITKSDGCRTLLITGPWKSEFKELRFTGGNIPRVKGEHCIQYLSAKEYVCGNKRVDIKELPGVKIIIRENL